MKKVSALAIILLNIVLLPCYGQVNGLDLTTAIPFSSNADDKQPGVLFIQFTAKMRSSKVFF